MSDQSGNESAKSDEDKETKIRKRSNTDPSDSNGEKKSSKKSSKIIRKFLNSSSSDEEEGSEKDVRKKSDSDKSLSEKDSEKRSKKKMKRKSPKESHFSSDDESDKETRSKVRTKRKRSNSDISSNDERKNLRRSVSDSSSEAQSEKVKHSKSDSDDGVDDEVERPTTIPDISDDDENDDEIAKPNEDKKFARDDERSSSPELQEEEDDDKKDSIVSDFDMMLQKKRELNRRFRKKTGIDVINDNDDAIAKLIADMRQAARDDRTLHTQGLPATKKIGMLNHVVAQLNKADLVMAFIEANVLSVITDWLAPIGERKILPHVQIRNRMLQFCESVPLDASRLKESGIGKAVMYLSSHPKETRENRDLSRKLISKWSRPIFNLNADFSSMSREERQRRDREMALKLREISNNRGTSSKSEQDSELNSKPLRPGDVGWVCRARVPMVDNREYVLRPEWQSTADISRAPTKKSGMSLFEKHKRLYADRKKNGKMRSGVKLSLEGKNTLNIL